MEDQAAVNTPAETTAQTAPAPVLNQTVPDQTTPVGEYSHPDQRTSPTVPYERFKEVNDRLKAIEDRFAPQPAAQPSQTAYFDPETTQGIVALTRAELAEERRQAELRKAEAFAVRNAQELADPLLRGAVLVEIQEAQQRGEYIDQEVALANAKRTLETRLGSKVEAAAKEATDEQRAIARRKEQAGAVGGTNASTPDIDPETLSAAEYAEYMAIPRV